MAVKKVHSSLSGLGYVYQKKEEKICYNGICFKWKMRKARPGIFSIFAWGTESMKNTHTIILSEVFSIHNLFKLTHVRSAKETENCVEKIIIGEKMVDFIVELYIVINFKSNIVFFLFSNVGKCDTFSV